MNTTQPGWKSIRMVNMPHPREAGMRVIGWVVPVEDTEPLGMVSEAIVRILKTPPRAIPLKE